MSVRDTSGSIQRVMHHDIKPEVLCIDELGYFSIDKFGADCLFQILIRHYEMATFKTVRVHVNDHVEMERHRFSVPNALVGQSLDAWLTRCVARGITN